MISAHDETWLGPSHGLVTRQLPRTQYHFPYEKTAEILILIPHEMTQNLFSGTPREGCFDPARLLQIETFRLGGPAAARFVPTGMIRRLVCGQNAGLALIPFGLNMVRFYVHQ